MELLVEHFKVTLFRFKNNPWTEKKKILHYVLL